MSDRDKLMQNGIRLSVEFTNYGNLVRFQTATRDQLIEVGFAKPYMFEQMGNQKTRRGATENGDTFWLQRTAAGFRLELWLCHEPQKPFGSGKRSPETTDISGILELIGGAS